MSDDYFAEPPKRFRMPKCTDTAGEPISRVGKVSIRRVMETPVNITGGSPATYALVYCERLGISLSRNGSNSRTAEWILSTCYPPKTRSWEGTRGRESAIKKFLKLLRIGKAYTFPQQPRSKPVLSDKPGPKRRCR